MRNTNRTAFVLGAGFSAHQGYPLARDLQPHLLDLMQRWSIEGWGDEYRQACELVDEGGTLAFEEIAAKLSAQLGSKREDHRAWYEMTWGLTKIFSTCSIMPLRQEYINFCNHLLHRERGPAAVITFNWDLLIETAIEECPGTSGRVLLWTYDNAHGKVSVIKPHGSFNWSTHRLRELEAADPSWTPIAKNSPINWFRRHPPVFPFKGDGGNRHLQCLLRPGPDEFHSHALAPVREQARTVVDRADKLVFIGYSLPGYDRDEFQTIFPSTFQGQVEIINPDSRSIQAISEYFSQSKAIGVDRRFEESEYAQPAP